MSLPVHRKVGVDDDILDLARYISTHNLEIAIRFIDAVEDSIFMLADHPGIGSLKPFDTRSLVGIRTWWVRGFPNRLIYYLIHTNRIEIIAILHGSRDPLPVLTSRC